MLRAWCPRALVPLTGWERDVRSACRKVNFTPLWAVPHWHGGGGVVPEGLFGTSEEHNQLCAGYSQGRCVSAQLDVVPPLGEPPDSPWEEGEAQGARPRS